jgi:hypothetical protein
MKKLLILLLGVLFCVSCVKLNTKYIEKNYFLLSVADPGYQEADNYKAGYTIKIMNMYVASDFRGTQFTYRINENQYMSDYYNCFYITPDENIQEVIRNWFTKTGAFKYTLEDVTMVDTDFIIKPYLIAIFGDYRDATNPEAVLTLGFSFLDNRGTKPVLLFYKDYKVIKKVDNKSSQDLVKGWNIALSDILIDFGTDLRVLAQELKKDKVDE